MLGWDCLLNQARPSWFIPATTRNSQNSVTWGLKPLSFIIDPSFKMVLDTQYYPFITYHSRPPKIYQNRCIKSLERLVASAEISKCLHILIDKKKRSLFFLASKNLCCNLLNRWQLGFFERNINCFKEWGCFQP